MSLLAGWPACAAPNCQVTSAPRVPVLVELYTSEGCSSCPPADRWLSTLRARPGVLALAFHVDYWDRLGWKDRFADPAYTQRQAVGVRRQGGTTVYTPQVVVDGIDEPDWRRLELPGALPRPAATLDISIVHDGDGYAAQVRPLASAPARLGAFWAVTEDRHTSAVRAGENQGATLRHDFVVREYRPVAAWRSAPGTPLTLRFQPALVEDPEHPRRTHLVVVDADSGRPVQAVAIAC